MTLSTAISAFDDCHRVMSLALEDTRGSRARFPTYEKAAYFGNRCNRLRILDRRESRRMLEATDPGYDTSEFDRLVIRKARQSADGWWWIYVEHVGIDLDVVEALSEAAPMQPAEPVRLIEVLPEPQQLRLSRRP